MRIRIVVPWIIIGLAIGIISCTEEKVVDYSPPTVTVKGTVYAWFCGIGDIWNNPSDVRYTVRTGLPATVKFVRRGNCCIFSGQTGESSTYEIRPELGEYFAVIETRHCHPDTIYNITITRDTTIDFDIVYEYFNDNIVYIYYIYPSANDSMGYAAEWNYIENLNTWIGDMLVLDSARRTVRGSYRVYVAYAISTRPEYTPWQVEDKVLPLLQDPRLPESLIFSHEIIVCRN